MSRHQPAGATEACLGVRDRSSGAQSRSPNDLGSELLSHPTEPTWYNSRGSSSAIDYLLYRAPSATLKDAVLSGPEEVLETDHRPVWGDMVALFFRGHVKRTAWTHLCGKWTVHGGRFLQECNSMAENLDLSARESDEDQFGHACNANASRSGTLRYRDSSDILDMVKARRQLSGREARLAAVQILAARKRAKPSGFRTSWTEQLRGTFAQLVTSADVDTRQGRNCTVTPCEQGASIKQSRTCAIFTHANSLQTIYIRAVVSWPCTWLEQALCLLRVSLRMKKLKLLFTA